MRMIDFEHYFKNPNHIYHRIKHYLNIAQFLIFANLNRSKLINIIKLVKAFLFKDTIIDAYPFILKVDLTPFCNLKCNYCIHTQLKGYQKQYINNKMLMSKLLFNKICDEITDKTAILSLYFFGESLFNKDIFEMIKYASDKKINTFLSTNFSVNLTEFEIEKLVLNGLSVITVCLDAISQKIYEIYRVGGNVEIVKKNLIKLINIRNNLNYKRPYIVVKSLIFPHNLLEKTSIYNFCKKIDVDYLVFVKGLPNEPNDYYAENLCPKNTKYMTKCGWPYFASIVLYNGDIVPCCNFRTYEIYSLPRFDKKLGNINNKTFMEVFNSEKYQMARKLCCNPIVENSIVNHFCYSCKKIYH